MSGIRRVVLAIIRRISYLFKAYVLRDKFLLAHIRWVKDRGDETLRLEYALDRNSIVIDGGGYKGDFSKNIFDRYGSKIFIFEPVSKYADDIKLLFKDNKSVSVFKCGLSDKDGTMQISLQDDASSTFLINHNTETIQMRSVVDVLQELDINKIDLFKINVEGGEFEILPALIDSGLIKMIDNIQVQFHEFIDNAHIKRDLIRSKLSKTHYLTYDYYFVWENWKRKED